MNYLINMSVVCKNSPLKKLTPLITRIDTRSLMRERRAETCKVMGRKSDLSCMQYELFKWPGGKEYFGFTYYPRYPDQEDPKWKPSELFLIKRIKPYKGQFRGYKSILKKLRIEQETCDTTVVMNSEHMNAMLWKIKHLIQITPITFPDGYPTEKDIGNCHLYDNGEFRINTDLGIKPKSLAATEEFHKKTDRLDKHTVDKYLRYQWLNPYRNFLKDV